MNIFALLIYKWIVLFWQRAPWTLENAILLLTLLCHPLMNVIMGTFFIYGTFTYPLFIIADNYTVVYLLPPGWKARACLTLISMVPALLVEKKS